MLLNFSVSNFRSFGEQETFSLIAGSRESNHRTHLVAVNDAQASILRTAVVYGANGSGKSNLYRAIKFVHDMATRDIAIEGMIRCPRFAFNTLTADDSIFRISFTSMEGVYVYEIAIGAGLIVREFAGKLIKGNFETLFERTYDTSKDETSVLLGKVFEDAMPEKVKALAIVGPVKTRTFLSLVSESVPHVEQRGEDMAAICDWFDKLLFIAPTEEYGGSLVSEYAKPDFHDFAKSILEAAAGVSDVWIDSREMDESEIREVLPRDKAESTFEALRHNVPVVMSSTAGARAMIERNADNLYKMSILRAIHRLENGEVGMLDISDESDGTRRLLELLPAFYAVKKSGRVCVVDEMDRSIHALLMRSFLRMFLNDSDNGQLIFTTHESSLLDVDIFRRDEIWFAEKDVKGMTRLYSLNDYRERTQRTVRDYYLQGRYGATPVEFGTRRAANEG